MHNRKLHEGLSRNALDFLIQPLMSIDEYSSKISDKRAIVIGFFINELDPANDLSNFIDRSSVPILDTEVSPAPTPDGYYVVFVELQRDEDFPKNVIELLDDINNITNIKEWTFQSPKHEDPLPTTLGNLKKYVELSQDNMPDDVNDDDVKDLKEFWEFADLDTVQINESVITFIKHSVPHRYRIINESPDGALEFGIESETRNLQSLLGPAYNVWMVGKRLVVEHCDESIVLQNIA